MALLIINFLVPALLPFRLFRLLHTKLQRKAGVYLAFGFPLLYVNQYSRETSHIDILIDVCQSRH